MDDKEREILPLPLPAHHFMSESETGRRSSRILARRDDCDDVQGPDRAIRWFLKSRIFKAFANLLATTVPRPGHASLGST